MSDTTSTTSNNTHKITDILQWVLIVGLIALLFYYWNNVHTLKDNIYKIDQENGATITYQASQISDLKQINDSLYQKYKDDKNVESIIQYKYIVKRDTVLKEPTQKIENDSIVKFLYSNQNQYFNYDIGVYTKEKPDSIGFNFQLSDTFTIVNKKLYDDVYQTYISSKSQSPIEPLVVFKKKNSFWSNFHFGPQVGVGYGFINKKPDIYLGIGAQYNIK